MLYGYGVLNNHVPTLRATVMKGGSTSPLLTSLYAVYKAESNANDSLGAYNGTAQGGLTYSAGKSGNAFTFNGTSAFVSLPNNSLNLTGDFSISFWVNLTVQDGTYPNILSTYYFDGSQEYGFILRYGAPGGIEFKGMRTGFQFQVYPSGTAAPTNTWEHYVITKTNSQIKWYVNGVAANVFNGSYTLGYTTSNNAAIGALYKYNGTDTSQYMKSGSKIDELNIWNRILTSTEVTELYNSGTGKFYPTF